MRAARRRFPIYGYLAEFDGPETLLAATRRARAEGYSVLEAYTPLPLHELSEVLGHKNRLPLLVLIGGLVGAAGGFALQYFTTVHDYPLDVGGRPLNSWPAFVVPTFETTILCAALTAVLGMFWLNGLPQPYHPVFNVPLFELASRNRFFLMILSRDPLFDMQRSRALLEETDSLSVWEVPH
jgi:hypothetical protein